ncbi:MAG: CopG family transcriptional regulator [Planctomycetes bacterium]|nr:CopG family transcriptional regulator [Planctomycetota bacterium]
MSQSKPAIVTFKAEPSLVEALRGVPNRSAFIRAAVLAALENTCPLCGGAGILTAEQKEHWNAFAVDHTVSECGDCHEWHLVCSLESQAGAVHEEQATGDVQ